MLANETFSKTSNIHIATFLTKQAMKNELLLVFIVVFTTYSYNFPFPCLNGQLEKS